MAKKEITGKYLLELNIVGDGRMFLNHWDYENGNDVVAEIDDEFRIWVTPEGEELPTNITLKGYLTRVVESIQKRSI